MKVIHSNLKCPNCGTELQLIADPDHQAVLEAVWQVYRNNSRKVETKAVAAWVGFSESHTRRFLAELEEAGLIARVGQRRGWMPAKVCA